MTRIAFIAARFFDPAETRAVLEDRFERHLRKLRAQDTEPKVLSADTFE